MLTPQAIEDFKGFLDNNIAYAKVTVNEEVKKIPIHRLNTSAFTVLSIPPLPAPSPVFLSGTVPAAFTVYKKPSAASSAAIPVPEHYAAGGDGSDNSTGTALQQK